MKKILLITCCAFAFHGSKAQTFNQQLAKMLQDTLDTYVAAISNIKGMSASVYIPGQGTWQGTAGVSYAGQPITADMKFGIASNSKLFVSTMMLKLQENGTLSLDDSIYKWLSSYKNVDSTITIRQLLNHTSGISDPIFVSPWMDTIKANPTRVFTPNEVLSWLAAPKFAPGKGWNYSNVNYILAGMVAQSATGYHISKLIRDSILTPLNMDSTFYDVEETETPVVSHRWFNSVDFNDSSRVGLNSAGGAAGSMFSNSSEMAQWYNALFSGKIINAASMKELTAFVNTGNSAYDYALGLDRSTTLGVDYWGHGGSTWGYRSKMIYDSCSGFVVCGLCNSWPSGMEGVTFLLYRVVYNHVPKCASMMTGSTTVCQGTKSVVYTIPPITNATSYSWTLPNGATGTSNTNTITVDFGASAVSGLIMVSGVNTYGAGGNAALSITVNPTPATPVITQNLHVLTSTASSGNQWYNSAGILVGETNQTYTITKTDDYYTIVTQSGCPSDTSNVIHAIFTGLEKNISNSVVNVFPNPVSDELMIEVKENRQPLHFEISNAMGQFVAKGILADKTSIPTNYFAAGVYSIKLWNGDVLEYKKILKY